MHKITKGLAPKYLVDKFNYWYASKKPCLLSENQIQLSGKFAVPKPESEFYKKAFEYSGSILWNELPSNLCNIVIQMALNIKSDII